MHLAKQLRVKSHFMCSVPLPIHIVCTQSNQIKVQNVVKCTDTVLGRKYVENVDKNPEQGGLAFASRTEDHRSESHQAVVQN
jgi:hypothetical protein